MKVKKVTLNSPDYPELLRSIPSPPKQLFVLGNIAKLASTKAVGIVGSRAITPYGRQVTSQLSQELASRGIAIISGLALGVDATAQHACLEAGGYTVAVLPCGLDTIQPASNRSLAINILKQGGAIISEYPEATPPFKQHYIARNRIVSGLSDALLVTEASEQSGSLHTANFALEQGRSVLAVPGNITANTSAGTNNLIKTGATPVTEVSDIFHALGLAEGSTTIDVIGANAEENCILGLLRSGLNDINLIQAQSNLTPNTFNQTMTMLEISGKIRPLGNGRWMLG